ncbi:MAG TPA: ABC transporter substrate-binding protein [Streptosporangiaceae bacterium]|nr:ABC transporter substrate-binding protein [Streptosporangiaceae bacterium]
MSVRSRRSAQLAAVMIAAAATLGACGTSSSSGGATAEAPTVTLTVGVVPVADIAPLYLGIQQHFFASRGLKIVPKQVQQGSLIINQVISGALDIGFSNNVSLIAAASHGLPLHIVAAGNQAGPGLYSAIFVRAGSPIRTPQDLAGKHIAVNAVANVGPLVVNAALQRESVDVSKISYVAVPFPNMANALVKGQVDAVWAVEPFSGTISAQSGTRRIMEPYPLLPKNFPVASYFVSSRYLSQHRSVVKEFTAAMNESLRYAQSHPAQVRQLLPTFLKIPPTVAAKVVLPEWGTNVESAQLATTAQLARRYGYISTVPDIAQLTGG